MKLYELNGIKLTFKQLVEIAVVSKKCLRDRICNEWDIADAVSVEAGGQKKNKTSAASVNNDISAKEKSDKKKIADVGMFAQCSRRINSK